MKEKLVGILILVVVAGVALYFSSPRESFSCRGCNVLIIGVDTMRADHMSALGYARETTPTLDALATRGYLFSQAISPSSWTVPTFMAVFTGTYPSVHGVVNKFRVFTLEEKKISNLKEISPNIRTITEIFKDAGYATGGFTGDAGVSGAFGYKDGFDVYTDEVPFGGFDNSEQHAFTWLDEPKDAPFFMFFHGYDLHGQFDLPTGYIGTYANEYDGPYTGTKKEVETLREGQLSHPLTYTEADKEFWTAWYDSKLKDADARLAGFLQNIEERGLMEKTVIVVLSDHGEEFFEHDGFDHGHTLYDEQLHIPLLIVIPGATGGKVISAQVSTIDLVPTLLEVVGITPDATFAKQIEGRTSLVKYLDNPNLPGYDVFSETDYRDFTHKRSIRTADGWKYILTLESNTEELYDLTQDPGEQENLVSENPAKAQALRNTLMDHLTNTLGFNPSLPVTVGCLPVYPGECE